MIFFKYLIIGFIGALILIVLAKVIMNKLLHRSKPIYGRRDLYGAPVPCEDENTAMHHHGSSSHSDTKGGHTP